MKLNGLTIRKNYYDSSGQTMTGEIVVEVGDTHSEVKLTLTPDHIQKILAVVADVVVESAKEVAQELTVRVIEDQAKLLEHKS